MPTALPLLRFWLGLNVALLILSLLLRATSPGLAPLTPRGVLICLVLTALGFGLGLLYARYWPLPDSPMQRLIRMSLLAIPAVGLSLALGLLLQPEITSLVFALAAFLGAQYRVSPGKNQSSPGHSRSGQFKTTPSSPGQQAFQLTA